MSKYNKHVYSKEQYVAWYKAEQRKQKLYKEHSTETIKDFQINGYYIVCIQRNYDDCMNRKNEYGIQVWTKIRKK